jgi:3-deoxy-D-manno-octulosonate 8-phosphate phosphatase (KDO 8-P phosphatase)
MSYFPGNISYLRKLKNLSDEEFGCCCKLITPIEHIELGTIEPTMDELVCLSEFFNYPVDRLLKEDIAETHSKLRDFKFGLLALDVDGVLTDGGMFYTQGGDEFKKFNAKDGLAIRSMTSAGKNVAFISSGYNDHIIKERAKLLGVQYVYVGTWNKLEVIEKWCAELKLKLENVAYVGDDANDLPVIENAGLSACPADAVLKVRQAADFILEQRGGKGCIREFVDRFIMEV